MNYLFTLEVSLSMHVTNSCFNSIEDMNESLFDFRDEWGCGSESAKTGWLTTTDGAKEGYKTPSFDFSGQDLSAEIADITEILTTSDLAVDSNTSNCESGKLSLASYSKIAYNHRSTNYAARYLARSHRPSK